MVDLNGLGEKKFFAHKVSTQWRVPKRTASPPTITRVQSIGSLELVDVAYLADEAQ